MLSGRPPVQGIPGCLPVMDGIVLRNLNKKVFQVYIIEQNLCETTEISVDPTELPTTISAACGAGAHLLDTIKM